MVGYRKIERLSALADSFDLFMIDQFGVLHDGVSPYLGAIECLASLKARGKGVVLLSNSGKRAAANIARLADLGFSRESFDHVVTSGEVAWQGIVDHSFGMPFVPGRSMFVVGHDDHDYGFEKLGVRLADGRQLVTLEDAGTVGQHIARAKAQMEDNLSCVFSTPKYSTHW